MFACQYVKHAGYVAIENVNTIDERRLTNRYEQSFRLHFVDKWKSLFIAIFLSTFVDCLERFRLPPIEALTFNSFRAG